MEASVETAVETRVEFAAGSAWLGSDGGPSILVGVETTTTVGEPLLLDAAALRRRSAEFVALLEDAIQDGASVGYIDPVDRDLLDDYWAAMARDVDQGKRFVLAVVADGRIAGTVQLAPCDKPNQPHRADVQKLLVRRDQRRRGIGAALMAALEQLALEKDRWLLTLDTRTDSDADRLYRSWGWQTLGRVPQYAMDPDGKLADCT